MLFLFVSGVCNANGSIASSAHVNSGVRNVGVINCNVRIISADRFFRDGIVGSNDSVDDGGIIPIDGCIVGGVPNGDISGLDIGGNNVGVLIVSLADNGFCDGAAFAFSLPPHVLWL